MKYGWLCAACCLVVGTWGCGASLQLTQLAAAARPSSNVTVFFTVAGPGGRAVRDLLAEDFTLYEDGQEISRARSGQTLVAPAEAAARATLLVVDMSSSARASDQQHAITLAVRDFVSQVAAHQRIGVVAFDGGRSVYELLPFSREGAAARVVQQLQAFELRDPATNFNGAVLQALTQLDQSLRESSAPLRFGTLVVFTDGTDRANRVPYQQVLDAIEASPDRIFTLGLGRDVDDTALARIGKTAYLRVEDSATLSAAFRAIAGRIADASAHPYLLSYCSPARTGHHTLSIEARVQGERGRLEYTFSADGFRPPCDPQHPAPFELSERTRRL